MLTGDSRKTTNGTHEIGTMGVKLATKVIGGQVELGLIEVDDHLIVSGSVGDLNTLDSALRDDTSTIFLVCAPCNFDAFGVSDGLVHFRRRPGAEV